MILEVGVHGFLKIVMVGGAFEGMAMTIPSALGAFSSLGVASIDGNH